MLDNLLFGFILILLGGFMGGQIARKLGAPPLLGMMLIGVLLGWQDNNLIAPKMLDLADNLRSLAVTIILMRAGLGLDRDRLIQQGSVAIRLGFLPALIEAIAVCIISLWLFDFNWTTGLLLGCVVSAESPAVIVPGMLRLKNLGWGVKKGIADAILTGSALSDVLILLLFSLLLNFLASGNINNSQLWLLPIEIIAQIILGVVIGYLTAKIVVFCIRQKWTQNSVQDTLITASMALLVVVLAVYFPYFSGYLAVMAMGFFLIEFSPPLARRLRQEFNHLWIVAEIVLFVLMGATIQLKILANIFFPGLILLISSLLLGRTIGWYLATAGSNWTWKEKLFLLPGNSAKATVQAAIGAIPLSRGIAGGEIILAIAALSILITAPVGAWAIPTFAPKLLTKDKVDPTKNSIVNRTVILGIIKSDRENTVLNKVGDLARRTNGEAVIVCLNCDRDLDTSQLKSLTNKLLIDIPHQLITVTERIEILSIAEKYEITEIVIAQSDRNWAAENKLNSLSQFVLTNSDLPIIVLKY